jgi:gas vesicle protein GvpN
MRVHPDFRAIFTSNPEDYAGVHKTQNALLDRMITIELDYHDRDTEVAITRARADVDQDTAEQIVDLVRRVRTAGTTDRPTLRASIMIARIARQRGAPFSTGDPAFVDTCIDVLHPRSGDDNVWAAASAMVRRAIQATRESRGAT